MVIPPEARPQSQGDPSHTTNSFQMVVTPLSTRPINTDAHISTTMIHASANPTYGLANYPLIHGQGPSGHAIVIRDPPYVGEGYYDYSGPYTDDSSSDEDRDEAPRRRRPGKEPEVHSRRTRDGPPQTAAEKIKAHEAEILRLKEDMAREQQMQNRPLTVSTEIPFVDLERPPRRHMRVDTPRGGGTRAEILRADPKDLMTLGDPDDPTPPFTEEVMNVRISRRFKMPTIKTYDGTGEPYNHVRTFSNALLLQPASDALKCRAFPQTLAGMAQRWYSRLPRNSIGSFKELSTAFTSQFVSGRIHEKSSASLMQVMQGKNENLRDYIKRFTKETLNITDLDNKVAMVALKHGMSNDFFKMSLAKHPLENMIDLQQRASKYIKAEDSMRKGNTSTNGGSNDNSKKRKTEQEYDGKDKYSRTGKDSDLTPKKNPGQRFTEYSRLNAPRSQILMEIERDRDLRWSKPLITDPEKRNKDLYCRYHKDVGHNADDCR